MTIAASSQPLGPLSRRSARIEFDPDLTLVDAVNRIEGIEDDATHA
jgi:hypothetical protein